MVFAPFGISLLVAFFSILILIPRLKRIKIVGKDMHKPGQPEIPEMGRLAIVSGFGTGVLLTLGSSSFLHLFPKVDIIILLAALSTILLTGLVGIFDDLIGLHQWVKTLLPVIAALPLMALRAGRTAMKLPFLGRVDFGSLYTLVLIPLAVTGAANGVNMLAGFNGLEAGMGIIALGSLAVIAYSIGSNCGPVLQFNISGARLDMARPFST